METSSSPTVTETRFQQTEGPIAADLNGELAILDPASGLYFGLNEVGALIWHFLANERAASEVVAHVLDTYDVHPDRCHDDVLRLLGQLEIRGLLKTNGKAG